MKNVFLLVLALLSVSVYSDINLVNRSVSLDSTGSIKDGVIEKDFLRVINRDGSSASAGSAMCLDLTEDDGASVVSCPAAAGGVPVCILVESCSDDAACLCQTYGLYDGVLFDASNDAASAGQQAFVSESNAGYVQSEALGSIAASDVPIGVFYDSSTVSASLEVFINLR